MANLLIEIGNTAVKAAWSEESVLGKTFRYQGEKVMGFIESVTEKQTPLVIAVVSVRELTREEEALLRGACQYLIILDPAHPDALSAYGMPDYLSYDRAASLVAAKTLFTISGVIFPLAAAPVSRPSTATPRPFRWSTCPGTASFPATPCSLPSSRESFQV